MADKAACPPEGLAKAEAAALADTGIRLAPNERER